jgi:hypothetical protein
MPRTDSDYKAVVFAPDDIFSVECWWKRVVDLTAPNGH